MRTHLKKVDDNRNRDPPGVYRSRRVARALQGHRRLTRRVIEAFPEDELLAFQPAPPMRPFGTLALELIHMVGPTLEGLAADTWTNPDWEEITRTQTTKADVLALWDENTEQPNSRFPALPDTTFLEVHSAFGQWTMPGHSLIMYLVANEIHHRGQGYGYLRLLGFKPPAF